MNVLFYTCDKVHATKGGTERTSITIASQLKTSYGCRCFSIYERQAQTSMEACFEAEFFWPIIRNEKENIVFLRDIIVCNKIDAVIVQGAFIHVARFRKAIEGLNCHLLFAHHFRPEAELEFFKFYDVISRHPKNVVDFLRWGRDIVFYPRLRKNYERSLVANYKSAYDNADAVVLLSNSFIPAFCRFGEIDDTDKFHIITNGLSFQEYFQEGDFGKKKPVALIVARLEERYKNLTEALRIWNKAKNNPEARDWQLKIVGMGPDESMYRKIVADECIPDVSFEGRQDPVSYYKEASIFMMTSKSESWGLTLTEAQQMGVVPIAFDTYESLRDIITDGIDGRIIPAGDNDGYAAAMLQLMADTAKRRAIATSGLSTCRRFAPDKIATQWWQLLNSR